MITPEQKICIFPCAGLNHPCGAISRQAVYKVLKELDDKTVLGCPPATAAGVQEDMKFILEYPIIVVEGCSRQCVRNVLAKRNVIAAESVTVKELLHAKGHSVDNSPVNYYYEPDTVLVAQVSDEVKERVNRLLNN